MLLSWSPFFGHYINFSIIKFNEKIFVEKCTNIPIHENILLPPLCGAEAKNGAAINSSSQIRAAPQTLISAVFYFCLRILPGSAKFRLFWELNWRLSLLVYLWNFKGIYIYIFYCIYRYRCWLSHVLNMQTYNKSFIQCCGSGSACIRNFCLDPYSEL